jgi:tripartite-type tricarboxylate transporter receptor subunit TctC
MRRALLVLGVLVLGVSSALPTAALADTWPSKLIVPLAPGGGTDYHGRLLAQHLGQRLGQQVYVENRDGANGMIGLRALKQADPDGYTILVSSDTPFTVNLVELLKKQHIAPKGENGAVLADAMRRDMDKWSKVISTAGIKAE